MPNYPSMSSCDSAILPEKKLVCYYEAGKDFRLSQLDPCICTHLLCGAPNVPDGLISNIEELDSEDLKTFSDLKKINPNLYILLSLRVFPDNIDSKILFSESEINNTLKEFTKNVQEVVQKNNLDGIDLNIDYLKRKEYGDLSERKQIVSLLLEYLRSTLDEIDSSIPVVLAVTVAKRPYLLVNGFDLPLISKSVDFINLPAFHFDEPDESNLRHPGRLHGVGDMENVDSLVDLLLSFNVPKDKIVVGIPTFGVAYKTSYYRLFVEDSLKKGVEGKAFKGKRKILSHGKVCDFKNSGNWSVLRETDQTSPYTYNEEDLVGYDDEISARLKTKYVLLRKLGGVLMWSVNNDDYEGICGNGDFPLIRSVRKVFTDTVKTKNSKTIDEFEAYLEGAESRVVNVVDRYGFVGRVESNSDTFERMICARQGYYRHPDDCTKFYRCVKFDQHINDYTIFQYDCPNGLVFDERYEVCNWPSWSLPCDGSGEVLPVPRKTFVCSDNGYFQDPENCRWFYYCSEGNGILQAFEFKCPFDLAFDEEKLLCNWRWLVPGCSGPYGGITPKVESTAKVLSVDRYIAPQLNPSGSFQKEKSPEYEHFGEFSEALPRGPNIGFAKLPKSSEEGTFGLVDLGANVEYSSERGSNIPFRDFGYDEESELGGHARSVGYKTGSGPSGPGRNLGYVSGRDSKSQTRSIGSGIRDISESPNRFSGDSIKSNTGEPPNSVIRAQYNGGHDNENLPSITKNKTSIGGHGHGEQTIPDRNLRYERRHRYRPPSDSIRSIAHDKKLGSIDTPDSTVFNRSDKRQGHESPIVRYSDRGDRESQVDFKDSVGYRIGHDIASLSRPIGGGATYDEKQRSGSPGAGVKHDGRNAHGSSQGPNVGVQYNGQHGHEYPLVPTTGAGYVDGHGPKDTSNHDGVLSYGIKLDFFKFITSCLQNKYSSTHGPNTTPDLPNIARYGNSDGSKGPFSDTGYGNENSHVSLVSPIGSAKHSKGYGHAGFSDPDGVVIRDGRNGPGGLRGLVYTKGNIEYGSRSIPGGSVGSVNVDKYEPKTFLSPSTGLIFDVKSTPGSSLDPESKVEDSKRLSLLDPVSDLKYDKPYGSKSSLAPDGHVSFDIKHRLAGSEKPIDHVSDIEFHNKYGPSSKIDSLNVDRISKIPDISGQFDNTRIIGYNNSRRGYVGSSSPNSGVRDSKEHRLDGTVDRTSDIINGFKSLTGLSEFTRYDTKKGPDGKLGIFRDFENNRRHDSKDTHGPVDSIGFTGIRGSVDPPDSPEVNRNGNRRGSQGIARQNEKDKNGGLVSFSRDVDYNGKHEPESLFGLVRDVIYDEKHSPKGSFDFSKDTSYGNKPTHGFVEKVGRGDEIFTSGLAGDVVHGDKQHLNVGHLKEVIPNKVHTSRAQTDFKHDIPLKYTVKEPSVPEQFTGLISPSYKPKLYEVHPVSPHPHNTVSPKQVLYFYQDEIKDTRPLNQPTPISSLVINYDASPPKTGLYHSARELFNKKPLYSSLPSPIGTISFPTKHPKTSLTNDKQTLVTVTPHFSRTQNNYQHSLDCVCKSGMNVGTDCCYNTDYLTTALSPPVRDRPKIGILVEEPREHAAPRKLQGHFSIHPTIKQTDISFPPTSPNPPEQLVVHKQSIPIKQDRHIPPKNAQEHFSVQTLPKQPQISPSLTLPLVEKHFAEHPLIYEVKGPVKETTKFVPPNNVENQSRDLSTHPLLAKPHEGKQPLFYKLGVQGEKTRKPAPPTKVESHFSTRSRFKLSTTPVNYFTEENIFLYPSHTNQPTPERDYVQTPLSSGGDIQTPTSSYRYGGGPFVGLKTRTTPTVVKDVLLLRNNIASTSSPSIFPPYISRITFGTYTRKYEPQEEADVYGPPPETTNIYNAPVFGQRLKPVGPKYSFLAVSDVTPPTAVNKIVRNRYTQLPKYSQTSRKLQKPRVINNEQNGTKPNINVPSYIILPTVPSKPASKDVISYTTISDEDDLGNQHTPKIRKASKSVKYNDSQAGKRIPDVQPLTVIDVEPLAEASPPASTPILRNEEQYTTRPKYDNHPIGHSGHAVSKNAYRGKTTGQDISRAKEPDGYYEGKVTDGITDHREKTIEQNIPYHSAHFGPVEPSRSPTPIVKYQNKNKLSEDVRNPRISQNIGLQKPDITGENVEQGIVTEFRRTTLRDDGKDEETIPDVACSRAGLFRHPEDCSQFYECYWDKTINKFTLHIFECPVKLVFDNRIYGCNSAYWGPPCHKMN
ncbi:LOW QUALITY PROTEIN: uncharacterized protein LOC143231393 [Tachypleus tridentatus]|uniref:LOW QUALITY PROTEIN: uncharacterized protein LOC143231393 n=1 Tax=Tachypleus tridentatus TaxID=6853 RepID=UPI003FCF42E5